MEQRQKVILMTIVRPLEISSFRVQGKGKKLEVKLVICCEKKTQIYFIWDSEQVLDENTLKFRIHLWKV